MKLQVLIIDLELSRRHRKLLLRAGVTTALLLAGAAVAYAAFPDPSYKAGDLLTADSLNKNFGALDARVSAAAPPGTIAAYGGEIDKNPGEGSGAPKHPPPDGWLLCDGVQLNGLDPQYAALYAAIGVNFGGNTTSKAFNLPDLRGMFLRGVNGTRATLGPVAAAADLDRDGRIASTTGGNPGNAVGSLQLKATALPTVPFGTSTVGGLTINVALVSDGARISGNIASYDPGGSTPTAHFGASGYGVGTVATVPAHSHTLSGGDAETRPANLYVNYIIKN